MTVGGVETTHPFRVRAQDLTSKSGISQDGNGKVGRLLASLLSLRGNTPPVNDTVAGTTSLPSNRFVALLFGTCRVFPL